MSENRFSAQKLPAARAARGRPASAASSPYETTSPQGIARAAVGQLVLERRRPLELELDVPVRGRNAAEVSGKAPAQIRHKGGTVL